MMWIRGILFALIAMPALAIAADEKPSYDPIDRYDMRMIDGWTLRLNKGYAGEPQLLENVLAEATRQLKAIVEVVPRPALDKLRKIEIWVEVNNPQFPCMCYHPDERWLIAHNVNPAKTGHVELANGRNFISWTKQQPWMVLHELAHGFHDRFIDHGYENKEIASSLARAKDAELYGEVDHIAGKKRQHYAATNPMEYFAESSESYFGKNDFFPYDRAELETYDPKTLLLMERLWGVTSRPSEDTTNNTNDTKGGGTTEHTE
jgi:hypothetical protein